VIEPAVPTVCILMKAAMTAPDGIAPQDEMWVDTDRLQAAIDHCKRGQAVELSSDAKAHAFLSGSLHLHRGVSLLLDKDVTLYGSRNPRDYDVRRGSCGIVDDRTKKGCYALIVADRASHSGVYGEGTIDGRGGASLLVGGKEQTVNWWGLAEEARVWGHQQVPRLIDTNHTDDFTVYGVTLRNSASVHVGFHNGDGLTVWGIKIDTPSTARNTDGIDPSSAKDITIAESYIRAGSDNIAIKAGHGASRNISVLRDHFYWGHGMSIGSETNSGVSDVLVQDLSEDGPDNGIRIKSNSTRGGVVRDVTYEDICIRRSKDPITLDTAYNDPGSKQTKAPVYEDIVLRNVRVAGGGTVQLAGADSDHHIDVHLDGVELTDPASNYKLVSTHADVVQGPGRVNFELLGDDSTVRGDLGGETRLPSCEAKFVPFPTDLPESPARQKESVLLARNETDSVSMPAMSVDAVPAQPVAVSDDPPPATRPEVTPKAKALPTVCGNCGRARIRHVARYRRARRRCLRSRACGTNYSRRIASRRRIHHRHRMQHLGEHPTVGVAHLPSRQKTTVSGG
jgi:polygalacturonase